MQRHFQLSLGLLLTACLACGGRVAASARSDASDETESALDSGAPFDAAAPIEADAGSSPSDLDGAIDAGDWLDALPIVDCGDAGQPVAICVEYYAFVSQCFHRDAMALACYPGLIPDGAADLQSIEQSCEGNLQRLMQACR
jgi:hypothetical protein